MKLTNAAISVSSRINSRLYKVVGTDKSLVTVNEFPKSGGTWVAKLLATVLELPFIDRVVGVPTFPCVLRTHWAPSHRYSPAVYVIRDGRDVMTSLFHHRLKNMKFTPALHKAFVDKTGRPLDAKKIVAQMADFIELEHTQRRYGARVSWNEYLDLAVHATESSDRSVLIKYEDLLADPVDSVHSIVTRLFDTSISKERIAVAVEFHDKKWNDSNALNLQNQRTYIRKGVSGDWQNVFSKDAGKVFAKYGNRGLREMGYEDKDNWFSELAL